MITARNLRRSYGDTLAVDDISFAINRGETFGLLGPNGAGKTTTIKMLVGALKPDSGQVEIDGKPDPTRPALRSKIGIAPQNLSLYEELSGEENLTFFGELYGVSGARLKERVAWALNFAGLTDRRRDRAKAYSGGMQRRLNLACALMHNPDVLLLDEPTAGVDPQSRNRLFENIEQLKSNGCTILYTTHYMEEAQRLCDQVAILDHGKLLDLNTPRRLIEKHGGKAHVKVELEEAPSTATELPGTLSGRELTFESERPIEELTRLAAAGLELGAIHVDRPNLESVFLSLTGRRLRD